MVNFSVAALDRVFFALSDVTRRDMIERIGMGAIAVSVLAGTYNMSLPAVMKHVSVLEGAGLVRTEKIGRVRTCRLEPARLHQASQWLEKHRAFWEARLDSLGQYLDSLPEGEI